RYNSACSERDHADQFILILIHKIQTTIREDDSLLLTVAHRIKTVTDYDRLIILDHGKIAPCDSPCRLIQTEGVFREMCKNSGEFEELAAAAKSASGRAVYPGISLPTCRAPLQMPNFNASI
ncbi:hypothetical protein C8F04DRAFT_1059391, partial [Mycena alexandri]